MPCCLPRSGWPPAAHLPSAGLLPPPLPALPAALPPRAPESCALDAPESLPPPAPLQAIRHTGVTGMGLAYMATIVNIVVLAAVSLPLDGTDWAAQISAAPSMGPWSAVDWTALAALGSLLNIGVPLAFTVRHRRGGIAGGRPAAAAAAGCSVPPCPCPR